MRYITCCCCILLCLFSKAQLVSYTPLNAAFTDSICITFNLNLSQGEKVKAMMGKSDGLYIWAGAGITDQDPFEFPAKGQGQFNEARASAKLKFIGANRWQITMNPYTYFDIPAGKKIQVIGLIVKNEDGSAQSEDIVLRQGVSANLKEVVILSKKPFIEQQIDKTVVNVQADINAIGSSAFEILQKAPGISISGDDVISMSGKPGVNILIDGRPTQMSSRELAVFLRNLPGSNIDKIELVSNPSARFDAQGNAGIINIRLKKVRIKGTSGSIGAGYTQNVHYRSNGNISINHRQGKLNAFANISADNNLQHTDGIINRNVVNGNVLSRFNNTSIDKDRNTGYNLRSGFDFYAGKKSTFGFLFNSGQNRSPFNTPGTTLISSNDQLDSSLLTANDNLYKNKRYNINLNYSYVDTSGHELNIDADQSYFRNTNVSNLSTQYLDKNNQPYDHTANELDMATRIRIYALKADYVQTLKSWKSSLETGIKISHVQTENNLKASVLKGNLMQPDTGRSNLFTYNEYLYAAYFSIRKEIGKFKVQAGLRWENTKAKGRSEDLAGNLLNIPDTVYNNFFPNLFFSYKVNEKNQFAFSYSKRINRPDYQSLNPFETIFDIYSSEKGNPYLRPQYGNNVELKYTYRYALNVAVGYNHTRDYSQTITTQTGQITTATSSNIGTLNNAYLNINCPLPINKWWDGYLSVTGFINLYKGNLPGGPLYEKVTGLNYYIQQNVKLGKGWNVQLSNWYNAPTTEAIFKTRSLGSVDAGIKKTVLQGRGSVRLTMLDIFNTQRWEQSVQFANMDFVYRRKWESRGIRLQLSWNFGKGKFKARERETNEDAGRIKLKT